MNIIKVVAESSTMAEAARKLDMPFSTFKRKAEKLGIYKPNQPGRNLNKPVKYFKEGIIKGIYTDIRSLYLKKYLIDYGLLEDKCCICGWNKKNRTKYSTCELHHKDDNKKNNKLENLELLCPNHHSLTRGWRRGYKNKKNKLAIVDELV